ncbi:alpha/beta hydrolase family protein [Thermoflexus sp.]|uniref:alpha/beta hydrolase family protein n=1 Tax=Thermoflexus sp. TaxID=1969742 RepID=UPI0035E42439
MFLIIIMGCGRSQNAVPAIATPAVTVTPSPALTPTLIPTPTITPSPTPHPLAGYTIEAMRRRIYPGGKIEIRSVITRTGAYTRYLIAYPSDGLTITGVMQVPHGRGPFPVVILNHGYIPPSRYVPGSDTWRPADYLARRGYITLAPDFRGWAGSDSGPDFFRMGLVIDALNLLSSVPSIPQAAPERIGMWGHSMGGGVTTRAIVIDSRIRAAVLYAPVSADLVNAHRGFGGFRNIEDPFLAQAYIDARRDPGFLRQVSPIYYFHYVTAPVQIHQGTADTTTPPEWARAIRDALIAAGKDVEYYEYSGQGHAFQGQAWAIFLQRMTAFFDRHLKGAQ